MRQRKPCSICGDPQVGHGFCGKHYQRWRKYGDPMFVKPNRGNRSVRVMPTSRVCGTCGHVGPLDEFQVRRNTCKPCARQKLRQWQRDNPVKYAALREREKGSGARARWNLRNRAADAGIDPDVFEAYYAAHDGCCEICGSRRKPGGRDLCIDHDHVTGEFRGMLCTTCNSGLGHFKDEAWRMIAAIDYLQRKRPCLEVFRPGVT